MVFAHLAAEVGKLWPNLAYDLFLYIVIKKCFLQKKTISWHMKIIWNQVLVSINKALLIHGYAHSFTCYLSCVELL